MASSLCLLLVTTALIDSVQPVPSAYGGRRGLDVEVDGVRRQRREVRNLLPYKDQMMSYPASQRRVNDLYYQPDAWRARGLDEALQRLADKNQRWEEEEQQAAYLEALLRLLAEGHAMGMISPGDVEVIEEEEDEDDNLGPRADFQDVSQTDYGLMGHRPTIARPPAARWGLRDPQLAQTLLDKMHPQMDQILLQRARQTTLQQDGPGLNRDQDMLRHMVARILSSIGPKNVAMNLSARRRRDLSDAPTHRRYRRSLDKVTPPPPSIAPSLLRVKRLEEEEEEEQENNPRPSTGALQRIKRIDDITAMLENHENQRRQRRDTVPYEPQLLMQQMIEYLRE